MTWATEYRRARKAAFLASDGACLKCGRNAAEAHHIYDRNDNSRLAPLCFWCHLVAPVGDAFSEWLISGESGPDRFIRECRPRARELMMDMEEGEFNEAFRVCSLAMLFGGFRLTI